MNRTELMLAIVTAARLDGAMSSEDAISHIAALIDRVDTSNTSYDTEVKILLSIGATIWTLESKLTNLQA